MKCDICNKNTQIKKVQKYQYTGVGLENIFLDNVEVRHCDSCKLDSPIIPKILKLHNTIGFGIVCKNSLLNGAEIQFLRKNLRIKSQDWAEFLRTDKTTYSRWENGSQKLGMQSDLLIRYLYLRLLEEKREISLGKKIVESLSEITDEKLAIVINVEQIESYSYIPLAEALKLTESQNLQPLTFSFELLEVNESNSFLSEIEKPLPIDRLKSSPFKYAAMSNQELAVAA